MTGWADPVPPVSTERPATTILRIKMQGSDEHCIEPRRGRLVGWRVLCTCFDEPIQTSRYGHLQGMRNPASALRTHGPTFPFSSWTDLIQPEPPPACAPHVCTEAGVIYSPRGSLVNCVQGYFHVLSQSFATASGSRQVFVRVPQSTYWHPSQGGLYEERV